MLELAAFTGALSSIGALIKVANEGKNTEMTGRLIELQQKILEMQGDFGELQQKLFEAQQQNRELTETLGSKSRYEHRLNAIWRKNEAGGYVGPFCPICHSDGKEMPLKPTGHKTEDGSALAMSCQLFHPHGSTRVPIAYVIPKDELPEGWLYYGNSSLAKT